MPLLPHSRLQCDEILDRLWLYAMHVLSHDQQRIITQYFEMELSQEETTRHLGVSRIQVKHAVTQLKKACRDGSQTPCTIYVRYLDNENDNVTQAFVCWRTTRTHVETSRTPKPRTLLA
ncbi:MAG: sigma factor-like helix-turn-helix DNA-binding protein [Nitrospirales bacterium]